MHSDSQGAAEAPARLILGLGDPGDRYRDTRHNLGFEVVEELSRRLGLKIGKLDCNSLLNRELLSHPRNLMLGMPQTYMNRSGYAARCLVERFDLEPSNLLIVFDDVTLPLATLRLRTRGGPGGHRGMESVIQSLGTDRVPRLRMGIAPEGADSEDLADFVLEPFDRDERDTVRAMIERAADACESWISRGAEATMNEFNQSPI